MPTNTLDRAVSAPAEEGFVDLRAEFAVVRENMRRLFYENPPRETRAHALRWVGDAIERLADMCDLADGYTDPEDAQAATALADLRADYALLTDPANCRLFPRDARPAAHAQPCERHLEQSDKTHSLPSPALGEALEPVSVPPVQGAPDTKPLRAFLPLVDAAKAGTLPTPDTPIALWQGATTTTPNLCVLHLWHRLNGWWHSIRDVRAGNMDQPRGTTMEGWEWEYERHLRMLQRVQEWHDTLPSENASQNDL